MKRSATIGRLAWALFDWANSAYPTIIITFVFAAYFTRQVAESETIGSRQWGVTLSIAGFLIAITGPILGAIADQTGRRKIWIGAFGSVAIIATGLMWFVKPSPSSTAVALGLLGVSLVCAEAVGIFYGAMLPSIAPPDRLGRWSGWGWALGYAGGLACLMTALFVFVKPDPALFGLNRALAEHVRATFLLASGWYFLFALPMFVFTPDEPRRPTAFVAAIRNGWHQLIDSVRHARRHAAVGRFLIARMIYTDGLGTIFAFGGVYAAGTFNMTEQQILQFGIALNVTAGLGAAAFAVVDDRIGSIRTIIISLAALSMLITGMLLVKSIALFWALGMAMGIFVGPVQAASRTLLARIAPPELRNQMFGLYALSGKATSFLGPLLVGYGTYVTGSQRAGMASVVLFLAVGLALIFTLPRSMESPAR